MLHSGFMVLVDTAKSRIQQLFCEFQIQELHQCQILRDIYDSQ